MAKRSTETKSRIINVARTLYSSHGCDSTTLDDIITASGVTKGAFYHYFKSKEVLCHELIDYVGAEYAELIESLDDQLDPLGKLRQLIRILDELNTGGEWVNCKLILRLSADSHDSHPHLQKKIRLFWSWYTSVFEEMITNCQQAGQLTTDLDGQTLAKMVMSLIAGAITFERINQTQNGFAEMVEQVLGKYSV
jgi:TetR/AcrR family transcriptional repressor of nem operon